MCSDSMQLSVLCVGAGGEEAEGQVASVAAFGAAAMILVEVVEPSTRSQFSWVTGLQPIS